MRIGYARVSSLDQNLSVQLSQLNAANCEHIYREKLSGKNAARPQLQKMIRTLRPGDVVIVCKLDRLGRNTSDLLDLVKEIAAAGSGFLSLGEPWADTTTPAGTLILTIFAGVAQFERERMLERCNEGRESAKKRGVKMGRKSALTDAQQEWVKRALQLGEPVAHLAKTLNVGLATIYRFKRTIAA